MDLENVDKLEQSKELVSGLMDIMVFVEAVKQDTMIPITVLCPHRAVLNKVYSLLEEVERNEKERLNHGRKREEPV